MSGLSRIRPNGVRYNEVILYSIRTFTILWESLEFMFRFVDFMTVNCGCSINTNNQCDKLAVQSTCSLHPSPRNELKHRRLNAGRHFTGCSPTCGNFYCRRWPIWRKARLVLAGSAVTVRCVDGHQALCSAPHQPFYYLNRTSSNMARTCRRL